MAAFGAEFMYRLMLGRCHCRRCRRRRIISLAKRFMYIHSEVEGSSAWQCCQVVFLFWCLACARISFHVMLRVCLLIAKVCICALTPADGLTDVRFSVPSLRSTGADIEQRRNTNFLSHFSPLQPSLPICLSSCCVKTEEKN